MEFGQLRPFERMVQVAALRQAGIQTVSIDADAAVPAPSDWVDTRDYLRPNLLGGEAVLPLRRIGEDRWESVSVKVFSFKKRRNYR
jgi:hypothetical protein